MSRVVNAINWLMLVVGPIAALCYFLRVPTSPDVGREILGGCIALMIAVESGLALWLASRCRCFNQHSGAQRREYR